jgi:hypothetical protein
MLDIRSAAALVGRHPETVRRWVWSGRLRARREGNRLVVGRADVEALAASTSKPLIPLAEWADRARAIRMAGANGTGRSAADLVLEDRAHRSRRADTDAGR